MRGKYELHDEAGIQALIDQTSLSERQRLTTKEFTELWRELWNGPASRRYLNEYEQAKAKFDVLRCTLAAYCGASTTAWTEPEWGFPKGRRSSNETELSCALRETYEEAGLRRQELTIVPGEPLMEEFRGSNGVQYRHRYWMAEVAKETVVAMDPFNIDQRREIGDLRWFSLIDALATIRPYNAEKRVVLQKAAEREASA
jgi:8-oxo-dGTP pyrophosphatase MutT (NUDIX family)